MPSVTELNNFKDKLREMDVDEVLDLLQIDSTLLIEMVENYDPLCITEAYHREEGDGDDSDRDPIELKNTHKKGAVQA